MFITPEQFQAKLQKEVNKDLYVVCPIDKPDICSVHYKGVPLFVTVPNHKIFTARSEGYVDINGHPHRGYLEAQFLVEQRLKLYDQYKRNQVMGS